MEPTEVAAGPVVEAMESNVALTEPEVAAEEIPAVTVLPVADQGLAAEAPGLLVPTRP